MPFQVSDRGPPRFDHDFDIVPTAGTVPSAEEADLLAQIGAEKDVIVAGRKADDAAQLRPALAAAREQWWSDVAAKLRDAAERFATGGVDVAATVQRLAVIKADRLQSEPDILIDNVPDKQARFKGEFSVKVVNCPVSAPEQDYLDALQEMLDFLAGEAKQEKAPDGTPLFSDAMLAARASLRQGVAGELSTDATYFREGTDPKTLADNILFYRGKYKGLRDQLNQPLFAVNIVTGKESHHDKGADGDFAVDLNITVARGLPAPNDVVSPEKQDLFVQISTADTVIGTVCQQIREQALHPYRIDQIEAANRRARDLRDEYVRKLAGIAALGLEGPHTPLAKLALVSLKAEFAAREAGRIKNNYVRRLGRSAGMFAVGFLLAYVLIRVNACTEEMLKTRPASCPSPWWSEHKTFLLAAAGASIGTWVSFAVRRLDLPFEELALLDEHSLDPPFRILFVVALTLMACLLFWTGAVNIEIGNLRTSPDSFKLAGSIAVVVGLFCGLSERALATAMSNRAAAFVGGLAVSR